jgi:O-succinylbenzoate synthase
VVLKVQPLGGVRACLALAEQIGLPVVVSSALETSVGLAAGIALAAALPELPYACGLATAQLLTADVVAHPLLPVDGEIRVDRPDVDAALLGAVTADASTRDRWRTRLDAIRSGVAAADRA